MSDDLTADCEDQFARLDRAVQAQVDAMVNMRGEITPEELACLEQIVAAELPTFPRIAARNASPSHALAFLAFVAGMRACGESVALQHESNALDPDDRYDQPRILAPIWAAMDDVLDLASLAQVGHLPATAADDIT